MDLILGPEIISSYKRLAYEAWYALAEFVDNSTQAYLNNKAALDEAFKAEKSVLTVKITCDADAKGPFIRVEDNSIGMSEEDLENAVHIGIKPKNTRGRSKYGLGLKTGASWFGDVWTIETKKLNETRSHKITVNVEKVAAGNLKLPHVEKASPATEHWTTIEIRQLNRKMTNRLLAKTKRFLASVYRKDIQDGDLVLIVNDERLVWEADIKSKLLIKEDGDKAFHEFKFKVGKHVVSGWAGVLERGSRSEAGFSIFQSKRMITGWPDSYKPESIYGDQSGGTNDLVNQRLFGELNLDGFGVSHTKDQILFEDDEKEVLEHKLAQELEPLRQLAKSFRKGESSALRVASDAQRNAAVNLLEREIESREMREMLEQLELPSLPVIKKSNEVVRERIVRNNKPTLETKINKIVVKVYLVKDMSPNDPYVIIESTKLSGPVVVIINLQHPHWYELTNEESVLNFIRHCTYDAVAEFKAYALTGKLEPDTVKLIKDNLLRVPMKLGPV